MIRYLEELIHFIVLLPLMPLAEEDVKMGTQIRQFIEFPKTRKDPAVPLGGLTSILQAITWPL